MTVCDDWLDLFLGNAGLSRCRFASLPPVERLRVGSPLEGALPSVGLVTDDVELLELWR